MDDQDPTRQFIVRGHVTLSNRYRCVLLRSKTSSTRVQLDYDSAGEGKVSGDIP